MVRLAQVLAVHHASVGPIVRFHQGDGVLLLESADNTVVTPLVHDYFIWGVESDQFVTKAATLQQAVVPGAGLEIWSLGALSPRLQAALVERGYGIRTHVGEDYPNFERPRKGLKRLEQRYERRVEDPLRDRARRQFGIPQRERLVLQPLGPAGGADAVGPGESVVYPEVHPQAVTRSVASREHTHPTGYPIRDVVGKRLHREQD